VRNTLWLTALAASNYLFGFLIIPYWTRVLTPGAFALVSVGLVIAAYLQMISDFGFAISGTGAIAALARDGADLSMEYSATMWAKLCLSVLSTLVFCSVVLLVPQLATDRLVLTLFCVSGALAGLTPDFAYRGIERMAAIAIRMAIIKAFSFGASVVLVRSDADAALIPVFTIIANGACVLWMVLDLRRLGFQWRASRLVIIGRTIRTATMFFWSRVAANLYTTTNTFVLGLFLGTGSIQVARYSAADKVGAALSSLTSPLSDSLYPRMMHAPSLRTIQRVLVASVPPLTVACVVVGLIADSICAWLFGPDYGPAGTYLRLLLAIVVVKYVGLITGFPALSPIGLSRIVNLSVIIGGITQVVQIVTLIVIGHLTVVGVCVASLVTQTVVTGIKVVALIRHRHRYAEVQPDAPSDVEDMS